MLANDDSHGAPETISATSDPAHGSVEIVGTAAGNPPQHVKYTPDAGFAGSIVECPHRGSPISLRP